MNYRHGFHAGNFADVLKHAVLSRVLSLLGEKDAPYRVIDTHAGAGVYDLTGVAARTGEYRAGIEKLLAAYQGAAGHLLAPYLDAVRSLNPDGRLRFYPGSPKITQMLARPQDRMIFCELHPEEFRSLATSVGRDRRAKAIELDGWQGLKAFLPPKERRGVILIDPPFEDPDEFRRIAGAVGEALRRFATGVYLVWYPLKNRHDTDAAVRRIARVAGRDALCLELELAPPQSEGPLTACGLLAINPPWKLKNECAVLLPALLASLAGSGRGAVRLESLT